jgi:hypothetical protein
MHPFIPYTRVVVSYPNQNADDIYATYKPNKDLDKVKDILNLNKRTFFVRNEENKDILRIICMSVICNTEEVLSLKKVICRHSIVLLFTRGVRSPAEWGSKKVGLKRAWWLITETKDYYRVTLCFHYRSPATFESTFLMPNPFVGRTPLIFTNKNKE